MKRLINELKRLGYHISCAESCTGGLVSKLITDIAGTSEVFDCAVTTYSNEAKMKLLGVKKVTLEQYGAVSEECACEMAAGVLELSKADIAVSVTGLAGPDGDGSGLPVGTVCIGIATHDTCRATTFLFAGNRAQIRRLSAKMACKLVEDELGITQKEKKNNRSKSAAVKAKNAKGKKITSKIKKSAL